MSETYNVYCDESCHQEHDHHGVMVLGAVWCPATRTREIAVRLRAIKAESGRKPGFEVKWNKVSASGLFLYRDLVDYFFDNDDLRFRALVIPDKSVLDHQAFGQDHDTWYYKMYYGLLKAIIDTENRYRVYIDIKDSRSWERLDKLREVLSHSIHDFSGQVIERMQHVRSNEVEVLQLTDLLIGAVAYANRGLSGNAGKLALVEHIKRRSGHSLIATTALGEPKVNILVWQPTTALS